MLAEPFYDESVLDLGKHLQFSLLISVSFQFYPWLTRHLLVEERMCPGSASKVREDPEPGISRRSLSRSTGWLWVAEAQEGAPQ